MTVNEFCNFATKNNLGNFTLRFVDYAVTTPNKPVEYRTPELADITIKDGSVLLSSNKGATLSDGTQYKGEPYRIM